MLFFFSNASDFVTRNGHGSKICFGQIFDYVDSNDSNNVCFTLWTFNKYIYKYFKNTLKQYMHLVWDFTMYHIQNPING